MTVPKEIEAGYRSRLPEYLRTLDCVHCGLCVSSCPTYRVTGREADSPRGRIHLLRGWAERKIELSPEAEERLDLCIVCRTCESVCPSGIRMGEMLESFRAERAPARPRGLRDRLLDLFLRKVLPHRSRIAALTDLLYLYERVGLRGAVRWAAERWAPGLAAMDRLLPPMLPRPVRRIEEDAARSGGLFPARGKPRARVALFLGCITSQWYAGVHRATIRVLTRNGCDVLVPPEQTCCGALHRHSGRLEEAGALLRKNAEAFGKLKVDAVVVNAAGCGASLKEPPPGHPANGGGGERLAGESAPGLGVPIRDIMELLDEIGIEAPEHPFPRRVAHHQACHLVHAQRIGPGAVERLLRAVPGLELVPLADADQCCGAGGIYNLLHPDMARQVLAPKVEAVLASGAEVVVTANPGCWLQVRSGLEGRGIEVLHPIEVLDRAYGD